MSFHHCDFSRNNQPNSRKNLSSGSSTFITIPPRLVNNKYLQITSEAKFIIEDSIASSSPNSTIPAVAAANGFVRIEAFRQIKFDDLPSNVINQLRSDGTRGDLRDIQQAREVYEQNVPAEAHGSIKGVESITDNVLIHWMHIKPHASGGSSDPTNGVYGPAELNHAIGNRPMSPEEVARAEEYILDTAEQATPGVTGDLIEVIGDTLEISALGGVMVGGMAAVQRLVKAHGFRNAGRYDLATKAENQILEDATKGVVSGMIRGTTVATAQAVLGANPLSASIGLVVPDVLVLLSKRNQLSNSEYNQKTFEVVGKGALAAVLICTGPIGWVGLAGYSIISAYGSAVEEAKPSLI